MIRKYFTIFMMVLGLISLVACDTFVKGINFKEIFDNVVIEYQDEDTEDSVTKDIILPGSSEVNADAVLAWSSSRTQVISKDGFVTRQEKDVKVRLILTVTVKEEEDFTVYWLTVKGLDESPNLGIKHKVTFDFENGENNRILEVLHNNTVNMPATPYRYGYEFLRWELNGSEYNFSTAVTDSITLKAVWKEKDTDERRLVFYDEFDGSILDTSKWEYQEGTGYEYGNWAWGNQEKQFYTRDNISVSDGVLNIEAKRETGRTSDQHFQYTSGKIVSYEVNNGFRNNEDGFRQAFGRFEARIKLPIGQGLWPAFWLMPAEDTYGRGWPFNGEIDIMEARGRLPREVSSALHFNDQGEDPTFAGWSKQSHRYISQNYTLPNGTINDFHTYAVEWSPGKLEFSVDGYVYHTVYQNTFSNYSGTAPFDKPFYIIFNLAVGGHFDEFREPTNNDLPAVMQVDWIRVHEGILT